MRIVNLACAALISAAFVSVSLPAVAQDAGSNAGSFSGPSAESNRTVKQPPLDINGCWSGSVNDDADGSGDAEFDFTQHGKKLNVHTNSFNFSWSDDAFAEGPLKGNVSATAFTFTGNAGAGCEVKGSGAGDASALTGTIEFRGNCASLFQDVSFSIAPGCP